MTDFEVYSSSKSSIAYLLGLRPSIKVDPIYQRQGEVWPRSKQQLLIDSIINGFDIPKVYLHSHSWVEEGANRFKYSLVDGSQRLEAIWDFLDGKYALANEFVNLEDGSTSAAGLSFSELQREHPELATNFSATNLDVKLIRTDDVELIEEMFSRLNEAVPLNAAEKRNGRGGPLRAAVRAIGESALFSDRLPFSNSRYRHFDLATKMLLWAANAGATDSKKRQLDDFWNEIKDSDVGDVAADDAFALVREVLTRMESTFTSSDKLLASVGMISVYFLYFQELVASGDASPLRAELESFEIFRKSNRPEDEDALTTEQVRLLEFDRLAQSPNDASALKQRVAVLRDFLINPAKFGLTR